MKQIKLFAILLATAIISAGCGNNETPVAPAAPATPAASQPVQLKDAQASHTVVNPPAAPSSVTSADSPPPQLLGKYTVTEVQHDGQVTIIRSANATEISFLADGSFVRLSRKGGKVDYSDSGTFRFEGNNQLILNIQLARNKIVMPPVEKRHKISASPDGSELRMEGTDGKIAVFRRTSEINSQ